MTEWVTVGRAGRPHGLAGAFVVEAASEDPRRLAEGATVFVEGKPHRIVESKRSGGRLVVRLDPPVRRGALLQLDRAMLPPPAADMYYVFELVGLRVEEEEGRDLGIVEDVEPGVANDVLALDSGERLPLVEDCVREIDRAGGRIVVARGFADAG